jgi:hypothetical protein
MAIMANSQDRLTGDSGSTESPTIEIVSPPEVLTFESLFDLYEQYERLLVACEHRCPRGIRVVFEPYHFFHLVKLRKGFQTSFKMATEKESILACKAGFGEYAIDAARASQLSWISELITGAHEIYEDNERKTADEVFIREYRRSGSPFKVFLAKREKDYLVPVTSMTVKRPGIKEHRRGAQLWPK